MKATISKEANDRLDSIVAAAKRATAEAGRDELLQARRKSKTTRRGAPAASRATPRRKAS